MASLRQELRYGLCCGSNPRSGAGRTLLHVKLTDTALRALEAFQNVKGSLPNQPSICFKGNQGYIKIPAPTEESPSALRVFSFYLSSDSKDQPQASFDCIHQYVSSEGREQLEGQGVIQDKITVCATEDSYQVTRERVSQVEKDSWSRSAIEIKPGASHPSKCIKFNKRLAPPPSDSKVSNNNNLHHHHQRSSAATSPTQRPLRERIIHLLALKPYRKPELLLWLERERAGPRDKAELSLVLEEVAKVNPKDSSYLLRDDLYKRVQRDWPGYSEEERQLVHRLLVRKLPPQVSSQSRSLQTNPSVVKTTEESALPLPSTLFHNTGKNPAVKRPVSSDSVDRLAAKRQKLVEQRFQQPQQQQQQQQQQHHPTVNKLLTNKGQDHAAPPLHHSFHTKTESERTNNHTAKHGVSPGGHAPFPAARKPPGPSDSPVSESSREPRPLGSDGGHVRQQHHANNQHRKKKSKKHKDKDREKLKDKQELSWGENSPDLKTAGKVESSDFTETSEEKPDYVIIYSQILSVDQRRRYQEDFCAEYDEYKDLHSRIATITHIFVQLGSKIKSLPPGTQDYKVMEDQILEKYNKYKKKFPGYREEKKRCEYLHEKLSFIKQLIMDFDVSQASS